jgi:hypothetical protein
VGGSTLSPTLAYWRKLLEEKYYVEFRPFQEIVFSDDVSVELAVPEFILSLNEDTSAE